MSTGSHDSAHPPAAAGTLRERAEERIRTMDPSSLPAYTPEETRRMLNELHVHRIELEMQNEELRAAQARIEAGRARYFELYDLAPVGYCTLSGPGLILEANLTAATLLGRSRGKLVGQPLSRFVFKDDRDAYYLHHAKLFGTGESRECELRMVGPDGIIFWARLAASAAREEDDAPVCRVVLSDITEAKRAEDNLRRSEHRFRQLFQQHGAVNLVIDPRTGNILDANGAAAEFYGWPIGELKRMRIQQINTLPPERVQADMDDAASSKRMKYEYRHRRADGSIREVEVFSNGIVIGGETLLFSVIHDITDRKEMERALQDSHALLERRVAERTAQLLQERRSLAGIIDGINAGTWEWNVQTGETRFNERWAEIAGYTLAELAPVSIRTWLDLTHPDDLKASEENLQRHFSGAADHYECDCRMRHKNGGWVWVHDRGRIIEWTPDGKPLHMSGVHTEITERKRAEELLRDVSARLQLAMNAAHVGVWDWDVVGDRLVWDEGMYRLYGISPGRFGGVYDAWEAGLHPDDLREAGEAVQRALRGEEDFNSEFRVVWPDGSVHYIRANGQVQRDHGGRPLRMIGTNLDITGYRLAVQAAEAANRAKGMFLANMSHEIRTPMSGVLGMTALLLRTSLTEKQRKLLEKIRTSGDALLSVINDILDYSKIDSGKWELEERVFSLGADVLRTSLDVIGSAAEEKGLELRTTIDAGIPLLLGDSRRLTQVLINLLGNAVKFTESGEIGLSVRVRERNAARVSLSIEIRDSGIGMTREHMAQLFTAFAQADATMSRRYGGSGLGLAISKQIVGTMGGEIVVESEHGAGSIFEVRLSLPVAPVPDIADAVDHVRDAVSVRFTGARVLVAEDHPVNREITLELLRLEGIEADIAVNGREAVAKVAEGRYDLVFMDIQMPEMDGYEATRAIRAGEEKTGGGRLPIVALTAHAIAGEREQGLAAGMDDYLPKPLQPEALHPVLVRWLPVERRVAASPPGTEPAGTTDVSPETALPGLDAAEGLRRVQGDRALYRKLLGDFVDEIRNFREDLEQNLRTGRSADALRRVHSMKGVSGNLGGRELMAAAGNLEKALRKKQDGVPGAVGEPLKAFVDRHREFLATVTTYLAENSGMVPEVPGVPRGTPGELRPLLENLRAALADAEPRPCEEILGTLSERTWPESVETLLAELRRLVEGYRMSAALTLLEGKAADLPGAFGTADPPSRKTRHPASSCRSTRGGVDPPAPDKDDHDERAEDQTPGPRGTPA